MIKLRFLETSSIGLGWMKRYYKNQPHLNAYGASAGFMRALALLKQEPLAGHVFEGVDGVRELKIRGSAFSLLYTFSANTVYIIDIRDQRGRRSAEALRLFTRELKQKYDL